MDVKPTALQPLYLVDYTGTCHIASPDASTQAFKRDLSEDSIILKVCACIPIIGIFVSITCEYSLKEKLVKELSLKNPDKEFVTRILKASNHYRIATLARCIFTYSIAMTAFIYELVPSWVPAYALTVGGFSAAASLWYRDQNQQTIEQIQKEKQSIHDLWCVEKKNTLYYYITSNLV